MEHSPQIKIMASHNNWTIPENYYSNAIISFLHNEARGITTLSFEETIPVLGKINFTIERKNNQQINIINDNGTLIPIANWNSVKVFLIERRDWFNARNYQTWSYFDFIYSINQRKYYMSRGSNNIDPSINYTIIPITGLLTNIIFSISRNENNTIFYEKDDVRRTKVRISDNSWFQIGYNGFIHRITDYFEPIIVSSPNTSTQHITIPTNIQVIETTNDEDMCIVCNIIKCNIKFSPCNHTQTCSKCCEQIINIGNVICPVCRAPIVSISPLI
jgi:hypothetical protein